MEALLQRLSRTDATRLELALAFGFLLLLLLSGAVGYWLLEGWPWTDGLYMTFITLTTIGFGEVQPLSTAGRFFTMALGLAGVGTVAFIFTRSAQVLLNSQLLRQRQITRMIQQTRDHYVLCGYGRIGQRIALDLDRAGLPFVLVELKDEKIDLLRQTRWRYVQGNAEKEETLRAAGIERAKGLILTLPDDSANVFVTLIARELNPDLYILARTDKLQNQRQLLRAGADKVISPYEIGADRMAQVLLHPHVNRFLEHVTPGSAPDLMFEEVPLAAEASLVGQTLHESHLRQRYNTIVLALIDGETGQMVFNPGPGHLLKAQDVLVVLGHPAQVQQLRAAVDPMRSTLPRRAT
jgi:voltage-gated potassium channel